ncbi:DNA-binding transcriptional regulator, ArsR family [Thermoactinomyces sp. DSM 45891]|uniref:transcriptional regulator n=1 Tax=Thermoactinomyces sp. DSM 45891 TaxID=1761907 RepID=UPI00091F732F|nr:transcriptional regulator [Thermoactinomyces sp. DSM 45891]SFW98275.1 DNA-binding transcriptional regulator, ArsR family [Thermoactinomyces sp. DSM 45891]
MMPFKEMSRLDKLIHEPARLSIMSALEACSMAEFLFLQELTGLTKGNMSSHLSKLEKANYVLIGKSFLRKKIPQTTIQITPTGSHALTEYWKQIDHIREITKQWSKETNIAFPG